MALRPARLLPPKRLLTPRSARQISPTDWGLLPGAPAPTGTGLTPAGLIQLPGRTIGSQGRRCRCAVLVPRPPFNPYVRLSRIRLTGCVLGMVTRPSANGWCHAGGTGHARRTSFQSIPAIDQDVGAEPVS